jgi:hypothetical protein
LTKFLIEDGFKVNSYDWCVANKMVDGKQLTIVWHVDDLKISHRDSKVVDIMLDKLDKEYGKVGKMTIRRGAVHGYLGMRFDLSNPGKVMIDMHMHMHDYINEILQHVHDDMEGVATTPAAEHLFKTKSGAEPLDAKTAELFHRIIAQLLFLCKHGRQKMCRRQCHSCAPE